MKGEPKQILSVSRRTDIPAFYMAWFMDQVARGFIDVVNPFNRQVKRVAVSPDRVHTMVFWSKNFGPFLAGRYGERIQEMGYHLFFNFTVNSRSPILEPGVPDLDQRLGQLRQLCLRFGGGSVQWRFDPICHFTRQTGVIETNLHDFEAIATAAAECGIGTCITSFMDRYRKIERRTRDSIVFVDPSPAERVAIVLNMEQVLSPLGIELTLCCENEVLDRLPADSTIRSGACISGRRIMAVHGGTVSQRQDAGQRQSSGCGCTVSVDVGSYSLHPCHHNCVFCYANPACDRRGHR
jgi:hypothetical protein